MATVCDVSFDWPLDRTCLPALPVVGTGDGEVTQDVYDAALLQRNNAEDLAVSVMWALSGRQFGVFETTVRPCPQRGVWGWGRWELLDPVAYSFVLTLDAGHWFSWPCGCVGRCTVSGPRVVHLPGPVQVITAVTVDGVALDPAEYQLEGDALYRKGAWWPRQDLGRPLGEHHTWSVTYTRGIPAPAGTDKLVGILAREFIAACDGDKKCRPPRNVKSVSRQGVTYDMYDARGMYNLGQTGIAEIDLWLQAVNPSALMQTGTVL